MLGYRTERGRRKWGEPSIREVDALPWCSYVTTSPRYRVRPRVLFQPGLFHPRNVFLTNQHATSYTNIWAALSNLRIIIEPSTASSSPPRIHSHVHGICRRHLHHGTRAHRNGHYSRAPRPHDSHCHHYRPSEPQAAKGKPRHHGDNRPGEGLRD